MAFYEFNIWTTFRGSGQTVHAFGGHIDTAFGRGCANKEYFLLCNKFLQFSIQFLIELTQSFMNPLLSIIVVILE